MKNILGILICVIFTLVMVALFLRLDNTTIELDKHYITINDGGYAPVYTVLCTAQRIGDVVEVEFNGDLYDCYVSEDSTIQTGDTIACEFACYEGSYEFINIKEGIKK